MSNRAIIFDNSPNAENLQVDIVIIGGGGAGLAAAVSAAETGVKNIRVLEKADAPGGNARLSHGIFAAGSPALNRAGINVSTDEVFKNSMEVSKGKINPRLVRSFINKSADML